MYRISLAFGHRQLDGRRVPAQTIRAAEHLALGRLAELFRGGRSCRQLGSYLNNAGDTEFEACSVVECYGETVSDQIGSLTRLARDLAVSLRQEAVLLSIEQIDGRLHWIGQVIEE